MPIVLINLRNVYLLSFIMNEGTPEEVLGKIFRVFDVNGDGSITMKEMTKLIKVRQTINYTDVLELHCNLSLSGHVSMLKNDDPNLAAKGRIYLILYCNIMD